MPAIHYRFITLLLLMLLLMPYAAASAAIITPLLLSAPDAADAATLTPLMPPFRRRLISMIIIRFIDAAAFFRRYFFHHRRSMMIFFSPGFHADATPFADACRSVAAVHFHFSVLMPDAMPPISMPLPFSISFRRADIADIYASHADIKISIRCRRR
jgi:hypothetical protein